MKRYVAVEMLVKFVALFIAVVAVSAESEVTVVDYYYWLGSGGQYRFRYDLSDGTIRFEIGYTRYTDSKIPYQVAEGFYIYPTPDGQFVKIMYQADIDGYRVIDSYIGPKNKQDDEKLIQELTNKYKLPDKPLVQLQQHQLPKPKPPPFKSSPIFNGSLIQKLPHTNSGNGKVGKM